MGFSGASSDTTDYLNVGDLRILDTIHPAPKYLGAPFMGETLRLGSDTAVFIGSDILQAYSHQPSQVPPGFPSSSGMRIAVHVLARDTLPRSVRFIRLPYARCPIELRIYRNPGRNSTPAWSSRVAPDTLSCRRDPNAGDGVSAEWPVSGILADSLPAGRYYRDVRVRLADGRVLASRRDSSYLTADPTPPTKDLSGIRFRASAKVSGLGPRNLQTRVVATNVSQTLVDLSFGSCALNTSLSPAGQVAAPPIWRSERRGPRRRPGVPDYGYACTSELRTRTLAPADSEIFRIDIPLSEVLADSLPFGRYRAQARLGLVDKDLRPPEWERNFNFDLGEIEIVAAADSSPRSRTIDGVRYTAATRVIKGTVSEADTLRTFVLITNASRRESSIVLPLNCGLIVYAYRTTADRDSLPLSTPSWKANTTCLERYSEVSIHPGQRLVLHGDKPLREIPSEFRSGRYYLLALMLGRPWVTLNAGAIDLK